MNSEIIGLAIGLNKVKEIVEKQKQKQTNNNVRKSDPQMVDVLDSRETRVYYDLPLRLSSPLWTRIDPKIIVDKSDKQLKERSFNRKVIRMKDFCDNNHEIPQWISQPIDLFNDQKCDERQQNSNKGFVLRQKKISVINKRKEDEERRSMSNIMIKQLEEKLRRNKEINDNKFETKTRNRIKSYDVIGVRDWMKKKKKERPMLDINEKSNERLIRKKFYEKKSVLEFIEKQKELRKSETNGKLLDEKREKEMRNKKIESIESPKEKVLKNSGILNRIETNSEFESLPKIKAEETRNVLKDIVLETNDEVIKDLSRMNGSVVSYLTCSVGTDEQLSPLTLSPNNSSLLSKSISIESEQSFGEIKENRIEDSIKELIERAVVEVPTWDQLCERVYKTTVNAQLLVNAAVRQSISPKSVKAMEVFPHFRTKSPKSENLLVLSEEKLKVQSTELESNDDSLKSMSSLTSSTSSTTTTPSTTKSVSPTKIENTEELRNDSNNYSLSSFESIDCSSNSSLNSSKELSVLERVGKIRKELNLSDNSLINISTKVSQNDFFKLTSDLEDIEDETDDCSSLKSEEVISSESLTKVNKIELISDLNVTEILRKEAIRLFSAPRSEKVIKDLEFSDKNRTPFKVFLFELCKEITLDQFTFDSSPEINLKLPLKLQKQIWPKNEDQFVLFLIKKVKKLLIKTNSKPNILSDGFMGFCRKTKKRDLVDSVLYDEICAEDWRWAYFEPEIDSIKEKIVDLIVDQLISESINEWKRVITPLNN